MKLNWKKCASVLAGGKPYFWFASNEHGRFWAVWNRQFGRWKADHEPNKGSNIIIALCDTPELGKV